MISKSELTQALALIGAEGINALGNTQPLFPSYCYPTGSRGKYGRNLNRPRKLLRRIKTTC